jgi:hypothetical protein
LKLALCLATGNDYIHDARNSDNQREDTQEAQGF